MSVTSPTSGFGRGIKKIFGLTKQTSKNDLELETVKSNTDHLPPIYFMDDTSVTLDRKKLQEKHKDQDILVMDVVKEVCRRKEIFPRSTGFFGLKVENQSNGKDMWMIQINKFDSYKIDLKKQKLRFRLQFKYLESKDLKGRDEEAYKYYLKQCRQDFKNGVFVNQLKHSEKDLLRMVILEMMIIAKEESSITNVKELLKNKNRKLFSMDDILRKYQGKDIAKSKEKVENSLPLFDKVGEPDQDFLTEIELLRHYREESFPLLKYDGDRDKPDPVELWITPRDVSKRVVTSHRFTIWQAEYHQFHKIEVSKASKDRGWKMMIVRGTEPPELVYCKTKEDCDSICSFMDGYCRLLVNQYDSILQDFMSEYLQNKFHHGPIEREVVPKILQSKGRLPGNYLVREHTRKFYWYVLSLIKDDGSFSHFEIQYVEKDGKMVYKLNDQRVFDTLEEMLQYYKDERHRNELKATLKTLIQPKTLNAKLPFYQDPATFRPEPPLFTPLITQENTTIATSILNQFNMEVIKKGTFGEVKKSQCSDGRQLIIKRYDNLTAAMLEDISSMLILLHHPHIVQFFQLQYYHDLCLAFEYLPEGSLDKFIENHRETIKYGDLLRYHYQITDAVSYLHKNGLIHADLRLSNVYLKDLQSIKLANSCITWKLWRFSRLNEQVYNKRYTHLPPEILLQHVSEFSKETDIWAYGLTIWEMYTAQKPFRNFAQDQLTKYMETQMDTRAVSEPALIHLNMHCLDPFKDIPANIYLFKVNNRNTTKRPYCSKELFDFFSEVLHMYARRRPTMNDLIVAVDRIHKRAPTKLKQKHYFIEDWSVEEKFKITKSASDPYVMEDDPIDDNGFSGNTDNEEMDNVSLEMSKIEVMDLDEKEKQKIEVDEKNKQDSDIAVIPENNYLVMGNCETETNINEGKRICDEKEKEQDEITKKSSSPRDRSFVNINEEKESKIEEILNTQLTKQPISERKQSHSAPSSPVHHKLKRTNSFDDKSKHMKEDIETASILVGMSQTASSLKKKESSSITMGQNIAAQIRSKILNGNLHLAQQAKHVYQSRRPPNLKKFTKITTPPKPPPPPDSPEGIRKDFPDQPKKEIPANDKTRLFLREHINRERDRFRGKRTSSYQEEIDEFRNNTRRAAKRAAFGPNAFNIETKMPTNFLLNSSPLLNPISSIQPAKDCINFFSKVTVDEVNKAENTIKTLPSHLEPYKTINELRNSGILGSSTIEPYKTPAQLRSELSSFKKYHTNDNDDSIENKKDASITETSKSSRSIQTSLPLTTSLRFPYGYTTSSSGISSSLLPTSSTIKVRKIKEERLSSDNLTSHSTKIHLPIDPSSHTQNIGVPVLINSHYIPAGYVAAPFAVRGPPHLPRVGKQNIQPSRPVILSQHISSAAPLIYRPAATISVPTTCHYIPVQIIGSPKMSSSSLTPSVTTIKTVLPIAKSGSIIVKPDSSSKGDTRPPTVVLEENPKVLYREIKRKDLTFEKELGKGNFGKVYRGFWNYRDNSKVSHKVPVAIKQLLPPDNEVTPELVVSFQKEAKALANLKDTRLESAVHIIKLYGVCREDFLIVTELVELGALVKYILENKGHLKEGDFLYYAKQVSHGMDYLHANDYLHRDLSCRNILVKNKSLVKICDFGLSRSLYDKGYYRSSHREAVPWRWLALESLLFEKYSFATDYWSYGVTLWEMFTLYNPHVDKAVTPYEEIKDNKELAQKIENGHRLQRPGKCPVKLWTLIEKCWLKEPSDRPGWLSFQQLIKEILTEINYVL